MNNWMVRISAAAVCVLGPATAGAQVADATGDFLPTYAGPRAADLDAVRADVVVIPVVDRAFITFRTSGFMGTTPGAVYAFGIDRGSGQPHFQAGAPPIGANVLFDTVVVLSPDRTGQIFDLVSGAVTPIDPQLITVGPKEITALFPLSLLPPQGRPPEQYTYNLWPRVGLGDNAQVADFLPNDRNQDVGVLPCPGDTNADEVVDLDDLLTAIAQFGQAGADPAAPAGDVDFDLDVDLDDLLIVLANFGSEC